VCCYTTPSGETCICQIQSTCGGLTASEIQRIKTFLTTDRGSTFPFQVGMAFKSTTNPAPNILLPLSFYSTPEYWVEYVGQYVPMVTMPEDSPLPVVDEFNAPVAFALTPQPCGANPDCPISYIYPTILPTSELQIERVNAFQGSNIYDAATWQIALALMGARNFVSTNATTGAQENVPADPALLTLARNQTNFLAANKYPNENPPSGIYAPLRAACQPPSPFSPSNCGFPYGTTNHYFDAQTEAGKAYFFRMVPSNFYVYDPLYYYVQQHGLTLSDWITAPGIMAPAVVGQISWQDFKPITGENAWAFLMGPLLVERIAAIHSPTDFIDINSVAMQNALAMVLESFKYMQASVGVFNYITKGTTGNAGKAVPSTEASIENNVSMLAGLSTVLTSLQEIVDNDPNGAHKTLASMYISNIQSQLMTQFQTFFQMYPYFQPTLDATEVIVTSGQGGNVWRNMPNPLAGAAVDVITWGISALGQPFVDSYPTPHFGRAYEMWLFIRDAAGYYDKDGVLWGVGYSTSDGNGTGQQGQVLSGEWTAGAINMLRVLRSQYSLLSLNPAYDAYQRAQLYDIISVLIADHDSMIKKIRSLSTDQYPTEPEFAEQRPDDYSSLVPIPSDRLAYMYANKRYLIPFGWIANPIPSMASTAWMIFLAYGYNPFDPFGSYIPNPFHATSPNPNIE